MRNIVILFVTLLFATSFFAEEPKSTDTAPVPSPAPCLVVKHASTVAKRLTMTALTGIPVAPGANFDYVDSTLHGAKMKYSKKELQQLSVEGVHVRVIEKHQQDVTCANLDPAKK